MRTTRQRPDCLASAAEPHAGPDRDAALCQYRDRAATYDLELRPFEPQRREAIEALQLEPGQTVLDVGCGTGLSLALLLEGVGASGQVVGIEQSPEMLDLARRRLGSPRPHGCRLQCAPAEQARLPARADAALFHFTHDVLRCPQALDHVLAHLRPGARIVATGLQWAPPWAWPVNLFVLGAARRSVSTLSGLARPYDLLASRCRTHEVHSRLLGAAFLFVAIRP